MALITRISRLFRADFNAVLDRIEEPDILLKQALREMEEDIHHDEHDLKILRNEFTQINLKLSELKGNIKQIDDELDMCFESDELELARNLVKRKLEIQRYEKHLTQKAKSTEKKINDTVIRIDENKTRLSTMQQKLDLLVSDERQSNEYEPCVNSDNCINENDIEVAFLREKQARSAL